MSDKNTESRKSLYLIGMFIMAMGLKISSKMIRIPFLFPFMNIIRVVSTLVQGILHPSASISAISILDGI